MCLIMATLSLKDQLLAGSMNLSQNIGTRLARLLPLLNLLPLFTSTYISGLIVSCTAATCGSSLGLRVGTSGSQ
jgi:uncharacterized membrane protein